MNFNFTIYCDTTGESIYTTKHSTGYHKYPFMGVGNENTRYYKRVP